jgi:hypothetical protein
MGRILKPSNSECYTPSSEPFRFYLSLLCCSLSFSKGICIYGHPFHNFFSVLNSPLCPFMFMVYLLNIFFFCLSQRNPVVICCNCRTCLYYSILNLTIFSCYVFKIIFLVLHMFFSIMLIHKHFIKIPCTLLTVFLIWHHGFHSIRKKIYVNAISQLHVIISGGYS